jgi:hypothetical protein
LKCLAIDFFAVAAAEHQNEQAVVLDLADQPVIPNAVSPKFSEPRSLQRLTKTARILQLGNPLSNKFQDTFGVLRIQPVQLALGLDESSTFHAMTFHHVLQRDGRFLSFADAIQSAFCEIQILDLLKVLQNCFANVVRLGATGASSKLFQASLDGLWKSNSQHSPSLYKYVTEKPKQLQSGSEP